MIGYLAEAGEQTGIVDLMYTMHTHFVQTYRRGGSGVLQNLATVATLKVC